MIHSEVNRITSLVRGLMDLSRSHPIELVDTDINLLVEQSLELISHEAESAGVVVAYDPGSEPIRASVDRGQIQQVLMNLALNAIQAMKRGGGLTVTVCLDADDVSDSSMAIIEFRDTGPGMPIGLLEKVFDPFYTTKKDTGGLGLGLSISQSIVENHGGIVIAENQADGGAVFTVRLPI